MWSYAWPLVLIVIANTAYNITTKSMPEGVNPYLSLVVTYLVGITAACFMYFLTDKDHNLLRSLSKVNWTSFLLGVTVVALEAGYIYLYRAGWSISVGSLVANISLAVVLLIIGTLAYREEFGPKQIAGLALCFLGLILVNWK